MNMRRGEGIELTGSERDVSTVSVWGVIVVIAAFGPYVIGSIRTEQIAIYGSVLVSLGLVLASAGRWHRPFPVVAVLWTSILGIAVTGALFPAIRPPGYTAGSVLAGIDNTLLPLALIALVAFWVTRVPDIRSLLDAVAWAIVGLTALNAVLAIMQLVGLPVDQVLRYFWSSDGGETVSVAVRAVTMDRFTGIFNQPAEAGVAYSLGLVSLSYLWLRSLGQNAAAYVFLLSLVTAGIFLSQSKIGLLVGLPVTFGLTVVLARRTPMAQRWARIYVGVFVGVAVPLFSIVVWSGTERLPRLLGALGGRSTGAVEILTAGRYGVGTTAVNDIMVVVQHQPLFGFGAGGFLVPYDSAWMENITVAGVVGLILYLAILAYFGALVIGHWRHADAADALVFAGTVGILIGGSFGIPVLTVNRAGTLLWLMLLLSAATVCSNLPDFGNFERSTRVPLSDSSQSPRG